MKKKMKNKEAKKINKLKEVIGLWYCLTYYPKYSKLSLEEYLEKRRIKTTQEEAEQILERVLQEIEPNYESTSL